jgi:hypothetical protein
LIYRFRWSYSVLSFSVVQIYIMVILCTVCCDFNDTFGTFITEQQIIV